MKVIVGLGNPGRKYQNTRHNVGFQTVVSFVNRHAGSATRRTRFECELYDIRLAGDQLLVVCPQTFMNLSGRAVGEIVDFYKLEEQQLLIVCDDFHLPVGILRFRARGSAGGQKGLAHILQRLGTQEVGRLRIGVGPLPEGWDAASYVLGRITESEKPVLDTTIDRALEGLDCWVRDGIDVAMNTYN